MTKPAYKLGLDIGNSSVKGAILKDDNEFLQEMLFPSAVKHVTDERYLMFTTPEDTYVEVVESPLEHFGGIYAVGERAIEMPDYQEYDVSSTSYKTNHPITTALLFGAIAREVTEGEIDVKLAVTIPIVELKTVGLAEKYAEILEGRHVVRIYRESETTELVVHITVAKVLNEGQAGFFGLLDTMDASFHESMQVVFQSQGESDPIPTLEDFLIVDIGEGTTDLAVFRNKKFNPDYSYSVTSGYGNILENAMATASRENKTIASRKELQSVMTNSNTRRAKRREEWNVFVEPAKNAFVDKVVDTIAKTYGTNDYFDAIIFLGGGFSALTGYTTEEGGVAMMDTALFGRMGERLKTLNKEADIVIGVPMPYAQTTNQRGLMQVLTQMN